MLGLARFLILCKCRLTNTSAESLLCKVEFTYFSSRSKESKTFVLGGGGGGGGAICIGNPRGFEYNFVQKSHANPCGYLLIIALHCDYITKHAHGEAVLFLAACCLVRSAVGVYAVYEIAV